MEGKPLPPHARALRKGRWSQPLQIYLITAITRDRKPVFTDFHNARLLIRQFHAYPDSAKTLCYVVMPDHFHWLLQLGEQRTLSQLVGTVKRRTSLVVNQRTGGRGALWQDGYHDRALRIEEDLRAAARYTVANPLRAGLVKRLGDYPHWDAIWL